MLTKAEIQAIATALHGDATSVNVQGTDYPIHGSHPKEGTGLCREVLIQGVRFMEQKLNKTSRFAQAVKEAKKQGKDLQVVWGVRPAPENWILVIDGHVTNDEPNFSVRNYLIQKIGFAPSRNQGSVVA